MRPESFLQIRPNVKVYRCTVFVRIVITTNVISANSGAGGPATARWVHTATKSPCNIYITRPEPVSYLLSLPLLNLFDPTAFLNIWLPFLLKSWALFGCPPTTVISRFSCFEVAFPVSLSHLTERGFSKIGERSCAAHISLPILLFDRRRRSERSVPFWVARPSTFSAVPVSRYGGPTKNSCPLCWSRLRQALFEEKSLWSNMNGSQIRENFGSCLDSSASGSLSFGKIIPHWGGNIFRGPRTREASQIYCTPPLVSYVCTEMLVIILQSLSCAPTQPNSILTN